MALVDVGDLVVAHGVHQRVEVVGVVEGVVVEGDGFLLKVDLGNLVVLGVVVEEAGHLWEDLGVGHHVGMHQGVEEVDLVEEVAYYLEEGVAHGKTRLILRKEIVLLESLRVVVVVEVGVVLLLVMAHQM